jgi:serine/threonine protein kinase
LYPNDFPPEIVKRFYQKEYQISAILHEKNPSHFPEPLMFSQENGLYVIKSFQGVSLKDYNEKQEFRKIETFLKFGVKICQILQFIHEMNIVHCDIKPENILYDTEKDSFTIIDFEASALVSLKNPNVPSTENVRGLNYFLTLKEPTFT